MKHVHPQRSHPAHGNHTPGPWHTDSIGTIKQTGTAVRIAVCDYRDLDANAALLAAAPELLAACEAIAEYGWKGQTPEGRSPYDMVCAAITKAKGLK